MTALHQGRKRHGRYCPAISGTARRDGGSPACQHAAAHPPPQHDRLPDVPAVDRDRGRVDHLPGVLLDLSRHAEQGADQIHRSRQFLLSARTRHLPDGDRAVGDLCAQRRVLQGADRARDRAPRQQSAEQGSAQVARHAAGAVGHSARAVDVGVVVVVRSDPQRVQLADQGFRRQRHSLAERSLLGALLGDPGERVVRGAVLPDRDVRQFRHRADHDGGRAAQHDARFCDLRVPARHPLGRPPARRLGIAVHVPDPRGLRRLHIARRAQARESDRMTATAAVSEPARIGGGTSLRRSRRWALLTSYFFLILFAIFFLIPPYYMIVTSLKTDAEVAHLATNPWIIANGVTLEQYKLLFRETDFLIYFKNTVIVTLCVVAITMVVSVLAAFSLSRMRFWGSGMLATGIFLTYLIPDTLLFIPL